MGGQSGQSRVIGSTSPVLLPHLIGQVRYGRGRKGKHKCWKQSLVGLWICFDLRSGWQSDPETPHAPYAQIMKHMLN